jgi:hypothetical protein
MNEANTNPVPMHFPCFISSSLSYANELEEMFPVDWSHISIVVSETNMDLEWIHHPQPKQKTRPTF